MARRRMVPFLLLLGVVALVAYTFHSLRRADEFDRSFQALANDIQQRLVKVTNDRDLAPAYFQYLSTDATKKLAALPKPNQDFQKILLARMKSLIENSVKLNQLDPLTSQSSDTLGKMASELLDIRECGMRGEGFRSPY